ncbi:hypothetical protein MTO96_002449 [Rhipicephalus appendiculatus]
MLIVRSVGLTDSFVIASVSSAAPRQGPYYHQHQQDPLLRCAGHASQQPASGSYVQRWALFSHDADLLPADATGSHGPCCKRAEDPLRSVANVARTPSQPDRASFLSLRQRQEYPLRRAVLSLFSSCACVGFSLAKKQGYPRNDGRFAFRNALPPDRAAVIYGVLLSLTLARSPLLHTCCVHRTAIGGVLSARRCRAAARGRHRRFQGPSPLHSNP